jgi:hypothetical protein
MDNFLSGLYLFLIILLIIQITITLFVVKEYFRKRNKK